MNTVAAFLSRATRPRSMDEDAARREFILNVLLLGALTLLFVACAIDAIDQVIEDQASYQANSIASFALYGLFAFFAFLYALSLLCYARISSFLLLAAFFLLAAYMGYQWGVDVSASLLLYALTVAMAGILFNARAAFVAALAVSAAITWTVHIHVRGIIVPSRLWTQQLWRTSDIVVAGIIFLIIALVMWLSNREIEKSLKRARRSEADLRHERDMLEVRVEERTQELRQAEMERMSQAYRFVEFGRLASGVFHDLMNPLAGLSLNIDRIAASSSREVLSEDIERAKNAAVHMQDLVGSMRKHLKRDGQNEHFSLPEVLLETVKMLVTHARERRIELVANITGSMNLYGDPVALTQVVTNLIGNAIHAYPPAHNEVERAVVISLVVEAGQGIVRVEDRGQGMSPDTLAHIFEPFFTTKGDEGIGLGLSLAKRIIEKDFNGTISVESRVGKGTTFTVYLPVREP